MNKNLVLVVVTLLLMAAIWFVSKQPQQAVISVNPAITYQTMVGWEATPEDGALTFPNAWETYHTELHDRAINELGINRVRLEIETETTGFNYNKRFGHSFDQTLSKIVIPLKKLSEARGEKLWVNVCVTGSDLKNNPQLYAQSVLETYKRMQAAAGFVPDSWEAALEPDVFGWDSDVQLANCIIAAGQLLAANGYPSKVFVAPSCSKIDRSITWFDNMIRNTPAVLPYLSELSYHTYGAHSDRERAMIWERAKAHNLQTMHGEKIGADYEMLHSDLKVTNVSSWEEYTLCWLTSAGSDDGGKYYLADDVANSAKPPLQLASRAKFLRQYFQFVRRGAIRIEASSTNASFDPVAFKNIDGKQVVVVKAATAGALKLQGLPAGSYGIRYTTQNESDVSAPSETVAAGQMLSTSIPAAGVITIYGTTTAAPTKLASPPSQSF